MFNFSALRGDAEDAAKVAQQRRRPPSPPEDAEQWLRKEGIAGFPFPPAEFEPGGEFSLNYAAPQTADELAAKLRNDAGEIGQRYRE